LIVEQKRDVDLKKARRKIKELHERGEGNLARFLQDSDSEEYDAILTALNTYEFVSCGIRSKAFSEEIYKRLRYSTVLRDWKAFEGFVIEFRKQKNSDSFFQEFEWLYERWKKSPVKIHPK